MGEEEALFVFGFFEVFDFCFFVLGSTPPRVLMEIIFTTL